MQKLLLWAVVCEKAGPFSVCRESIFVSVFVLPLTEVLLLLGAKSAMRVAGQLHGRSRFSAECSVFDLHLQRAVIPIQLPLQKDVCCWLCILGQ